MILFLHQKIWLVIWTWKTHFIKLINASEDELSNLMINISHWIAFAAISGSKSPYGVSYVLWKKYFIMRSIISTFCSVMKKEAYCCLCISVSYIIKVESISLDIQTDRFIRPLTTFTSEWRKQCPSAGDLTISCIDQNASLLREVSAHFLSYTPVARSLSIWTIASCSGVTELHMLTSQEENSSFTQ